MICSINPRGLSFSLPSVPVCVTASPVQSEGSVSTFYLNNSTLHSGFSKRCKRNLNSFSYSPELLQGSQPSVLFVSFLLSFLAFKKHVSSKDQWVIYQRHKSLLTEEVC